MCKTDKNSLTRYIKDIINFLYDTIVTFSKKSTYFLEIHIKIFIDIIYKII